MLLIWCWSYRAKGLNQYKFIHLLQDTDGEHDVVFLHFYTGIPMIQKWVWDLREQIRCTVLAKLKLSVLYNESVAIPLLLTFCAILII